jgi:YVTN family beta-propeller protein
MTRGAGVRRLGTLLLSLLLVLPAACQGNAADPGTLIVLTHAPSGEVRFLQIGSGRIGERIKVGGEPGAVVRDLARGRVYVTDRAGDTVSVVDILTPALIKQIRVGREPHYAAISPDNRRLYVSAAADGSLSTIDLETLDVTARVAVGPRPMGVAVSNDGGRVFVANDGDGTIAVVDSSGQRRFSRTIPIPGGMQGNLALSNDGSALVTASDGRPKLAIVPLTNRDFRERPLDTVAPEAASVTGVYPTPDGRYWLASLAGVAEFIAAPVDGAQPVRVPVGDEATAFSLAPGGRVLVASERGEYLSEVDLAMRKVTRRIRVGAGHADLAVFSRAALDSLRGGQGQPNGGEARP